MFDPSDDNVALFTLLLVIFIAVFFAISIVILQCSPKPLPPMDEDD